MEAKELRIWNYLDFSGKPTDINAGFICDFHYSQENSFRQDAIDFDNVSPIPLTEEWLLKFGFRRFNPKYYPNRWILDGAPNYTIYVYPNTMTLCIDDTNYGREIPYVHTLQNIWYVLEQKELQITETAQ